MKYPIALIDYITRNFADTAMIGYDIGCRFKSSYLRSCDLLESKRLEAIDSTTPLDSPERDRQPPPPHEFVVGAWHGYAHNRECQVSFLFSISASDGLKIDWILALSSNIILVRNRELEWKISKEQNASGVEPTLVLQVHVTATLLLVACG